MFRAVNRRIEDRALDHIESTEIANRFIRAMRTLPPTQFRVTTLTLLGFHKIDIANDYNVSHQAVSNCLEVAIEKLIEAITYTGSQMETKNETKTQNIQH